MWGLIMLSCVFVLVLGIAAVVDLRDHDRGAVSLRRADENTPPGRSTHTQPSAEPDGALPSRFRGP